MRLAANSCVVRDIKEPGDYGGFPAVSILYTAFIHHFVYCFYLLKNKKQDFFIKDDWFFLFGFAGAYMAMEKTSC